MNIVIYGTENTSIAELITTYEQAGHQVYGIQREKDILENTITELEKETAGIDLLIISLPQDADNDGVIGTDHDYEKLLHTLEERVIDTFFAIDMSLPLLRKSSFKRIGFLTDRDSSISMTEKKDGYAQQMAKASMNMMGKLLFNKLRPEGFTFRCYCQTGNDKADMGMDAATYMMQNFSYDEKEVYIHSEENRFVMRDSLFHEVPW